LIPRQHLNVPIKQDANNRQWSENPVSAPLEVISPLLEALFYVYLPSQS